jgi:hypothetical protein
MQSFSFAPANLVPQENQKSARYFSEYRNSARTDRGTDYVFVDEHNRHKRLKGDGLFITVLAIYTERSQLCVHAKDVEGARSSAMRQPQTHGHVQPASG